MKNHETVNWGHLNSVTYWTMDYHLGITTADIGAVRNGTPSDPKHICIDRRCVDRPNSLSYCSEILCNMQGVCNNRHHSHCNDQWKPLNCLLSGFGGSIDSGPPPERLPKKKTNKSSYMLCLFIPFLLLIGYFFCLIKGMKWKYSQNSAIKFLLKKKSSIFTCKKKRC